MYRLPASGEYADATVPALADDSLSLYFQSLGFTGRGQTQAFLLRVDDRQVPVQTAKLARHESEQGECFRRTDLAVGEGAPSAALYGVGEYKFRSDAERTEITELAIQCLILFGRDTDGLDRVDGYYRVDANNREYTLADFR